MNFVYKRNCLRFLVFSLIVTFKFKKIVYISDIPSSNHLNKCWYELFMATSSEIYKPQVLFMFDKFSIWNLSWQGVVVVVHRRNRMISNIINNSSELFAHFPLRPSVEWNFIAGRTTNSIQKQTQKPSNMLLSSQQPANKQNNKQTSNCNCNQLHLLPHECVTE